MGWPEPIIPLLPRTRHVEILSPPIPGIRRMWPIHMRTLWFPLVPFPVSFSDPFGYGGGHGGVGSRRSRPRSYGDERCVRHLRALIGIIELLTCLLTYKPHSLVREWRGKGPLTRTWNGVIWSNQISFARDQISRTWHHTSLPWWYYNNNNLPFITPPTRLRK